ncbi:FAD-binding oxidoreductase [Sneathiella marina]|uniref:FAD-binding oxidoreductase n=1 Tax=Sneathiella marina TaxID=2950108 RepID=A0ABY4VZU9_9PROT|nr:FAD-binding oxidoreductase [Sneathiella marina]USG60119.1 FAD-binding oxidoreductase [Sneathiella marina]
MDSNFYQATAHSATVFSSLDQDVSVDICIVGGGYTGLLSALELAERGYSVAVLEAQSVGWGASGRNGGQIATGYQPGMIETTRLVGIDDSAKLWAMSVEATGILKNRIADHEIKCDLKEGELYAATKNSHRDWLLREMAFCQDNFDFQGYEWISGADLPNYVGTTRYKAGLLDYQGGHLHPLNYALGLARAAAAAGVQIFEHSKALELVEGKKPVLKAAGGKITASSVILAGNAYMNGLNAGLDARIIPVSSYIIATEKLSADRARTILKTEACVSDTDFNLDYFRMSADHRLLYGGRDYAGRHLKRPEDVLRHHMLRTFPQLEDVRVEFAWGGKVAVTRHRLPDIGRIGQNIYYAHGFSGQGLPLSAIAGRILAEAVSGEMERLDVFSRIPHKPFPGGTALRVPLLSLAMKYYQLRDALG